MNLSELIKKIRVNAGLSRKEFAQKVGASQAAVTYWETGKRQPRLDQLEKIANAFSIDVWDMYFFYELGRPAPQFELSEDAQALVEAFEHLNEEGQCKAIDFLDLLAKVPEYKK